MLKGSIRDFSIIHLRTPMIKVALGVAKLVCLLSVIGLEKFELEIKSLVEREAKPVAAAAWRSIF